MRKQTTSKQLRIMFDKLLISKEYSFPAFLVGELNELVWPLKDPVKEEFKLVRGVYVSRRIRPKVTYRGTQDYLHRQLYRYFIDEDLKGKTIIPLTRGRDDYNPFHWKLKRAKPNVPLSVETAPKAVDPELLDFVDELKRRRSAGFDNIWEGVEEIFTPLEIEQAKKILGDDENEA